MNAEEQKLRQKIIEIVGLAQTPDEAISITAILNHLGTTTIDPRALLDRMTIEDVLVRKVIGDVPCYRPNLVMQTQPVPSVHTEGGVAAATERPQVSPPAAASTPSPAPHPIAPKRTAATTGRTNVGEQILSNLTEFGPRSGPELMEEIGCSQNTFSLHVRRLEADGLVRRKGLKFRPVYELVDAGAADRSDAEPAAAAQSLALEQKVLGDTLQFHHERAEQEAAARQSASATPLDPEPKAIAIAASRAVFALRSDLKLEIDAGDVSIVLSPECTADLANYLDHTCSLVLQARAPMTEKH